MTPYSYSQVRVQVNQSLKLYTSPALAFYALHTTQVTQMLLIKGLFSHSKLQTNLKARALSWEPLCSNKGGPKLVHYYYTMVFIYNALYKLIQPEIVTLGLRDFLSWVPCMLP